MRVSKKELLAAMLTNDAFDVIKNDHNRKNKRDTEKETPILAKWKGQTFFVSFNEKSLPNEIHDNDDAYNSVSADFFITLVVGSNYSFAHDNAGNGIIDAVIKYKIANYVNMNSRLNAIVIYREDADLFEISARHGVFLRERSAHQINGAVMTMVLTCVMAAQKTREAIENYWNSPEAFLEKCKGVVDEE